jgi:hypothetical protein
VQLAYDDGENRVWMLTDGQERFTYIALNEDGVRDGHLAETIGWLSRTRYKPTPKQAIEEVMATTEIAVRFDNLAHALRQLGTYLVTAPECVRETGSIVLKMPACTWARTIERGRVAQIGSSCF